MLQRYKQNKTKANIYVNKLRMQKYLQHNASFLFFLLLKCKLHKALTL